MCPCHNNTTLAIYSNWPGASSIAWFISLSDNPDEEILSVQVGKQDNMTESPTQIDQLRITNSIPDGRHVYLMRKCDYIWTGDFLKLRERMRSMPAIWNGYDRTPVFVFLYYANKTGTIFVTAGCVLSKQT